MVCMHVSLNERFMGSPYILITTLFTLKTPRQISQSCDPSGLVTLVIRKWFLFFLNPELPQFVW